MSKADVDLDAAAYIISSHYRVAVVQTLDEVGLATPSRITAREGDKDMAHYSRALQELRERDVVELLVPEERKKGRIYGLTDHGDSLTEAVDQLTDGDGDE